MLLSKIKWAALAAVATGFVFTSAAVLGQPQSGPRAGQASETATPTADTDGPSALNPREAEPSGRAQAERKAARPVAPPAGRHSVAIGGGAMGGPPDQADDPRSRQILEKLNEPVSMSFANETPLDDVLKYIKQATTTPKFSGIPIYVDPIGLQEAERSLQSTIQIDLDGVPLRRTLQLVLTQLGLAYFVEDGILVITGEDAAKKPLPPPMAGPSPLDQMLEKSERGELSSTELKELIEVLKLRRQVEEVHAPSESPRGEGFGGAGMVKSVADQTAELLKEVRELIQLLKAEKKEKKPSESK